VPDKYYRGPQQKLPGSLTRITGVLNKNYRGPQQKLPGSSTKTTGVLNKSSKFLSCKVATFLRLAAFPCIVLLFSMLFKQQQQEGGKRVGILHE